MDIAPSEWVVGGEREQAQCCVCVCVFARILVCMCRVELCAKGPEKPGLRQTAESWGKLFKDRGKF